MSHLRYPRFALIGLALIGLALTAPSALATTHTVNQVGLTFDPADLTITVGDTVEWVWSSGPHTVTNGTDLSDPDLGTLFDETLDASNPTVSYTFTETGDVPYLCRLHVALGMTGVIHVMPAGGTTYTVNQVGFTFDPSEITINVGDTVQWIWSANAHTVTNGTDLNDPDLGTLFDEVLDSAHPMVSYTFTASGDVPYLCRPHATFGMTGIVHVNSSVGVDDTPATASLLLQNAPNPFNPRTDISFVVPQSSDGQHVTLRIYDLQGRQVRTLIDAAYPEGTATATWDGASDHGQAMPSGTYVYRIRVGGHSEARSMTLVR